VRLYRGLRLRFVSVAVGAAVIGAASGALGGALLHRRTMTLIIGRQWRLHHRDQLLAGCREDPARWSHRAEDGVRYHAYDVRDGRSAHPRAPRLDPDLLARFRNGDGPAVRLRFGSDRWGGEVLLPGGEPGPCSAVLARWPEHPEVRRLVYGVAGAGLGFTLLSTLALVGAFIVRPLRRRVSELREAAERVGSARYRPANRSAGDELADIARSIDATHTRVREDHETIVQQRAAMQRFLADVAHDLRTPITSLQLGLEALGDEPLSADGHEALRAALNDAVYLASLTTNLRLATRLADGWDPLADDPHADLAAIVRRVRQRERIFARRRAVRLEADEPSEPLWVRGEPTMVEQAVSNVVQNAVAYDDEGGRVRVSLTREGDTFRLTVEDDGPGVPPRELPRLGDRTFRSDEARQRDPKGSGLGLAIAREVCERSGWRLRFEAREPRGLTVRIEGQVIEREVADGGSDGSDGRPRVP
jgi:signal transduction histidine kinase